MFFFYPELPCPGCVTEQLIGAVQAEDEVGPAPHHELEVAVDLLFSRAVDKVT